MFLRRSMMLGLTRGVAYRGSNAVTSATTSATLNFAALGAQVGDLGLVNAFYPNIGTNTTAISGWTKLTDTWAAPNGYVSQYHYKVLTASDITSGVTITGLQSTPDTQVVTWAAYSGPTSASIVGRVDSQSGTATTLTIPGGLVSNAVVYVSFLDSHVVGDSSVSPAVNNGFTFRRLNSNTSGFARIGLADCVPATAYTGANLTWSNLTTNDSSGRQAVLLGLV